MADLAKEEIILGMIKNGDLIPIEKTCIPKGGEVDKVYEYLYNNAKHMDWNEERQYYNKVIFTDGKGDVYEINLKGTETSVKLSNIIHKIKSATGNNSNIDKILSRKTGNSGYYNIPLYAPDVNTGKIKLYTLSLHRFIFLMTSKKEVLSLTMRYKTGKGCQSYHLNHTGGLELMTQVDPRRVNKNGLMLRPKKGNAGIQCHPYFLEIQTGKGNSAHEKLLCGRSKYLLDIPRRVTSERAEFLDRVIEDAEKDGKNYLQICKIIDSYYYAMNEIPVLTLA